VEERKATGSKQARPADEDKLNFFFPFQKGHTFYHTRPGNIPLASRVDSISMGYIHLFIYLPSNPAISNSPPL
jgi:hypothetical protein